MEMCTIGLTIYHANHEINISLQPENIIGVKIDGSEITKFPIWNSWLVFEKINDYHVSFLIPSVQLEVSYSSINYEFLVNVPANLFTNKTTGVCGSYPKNIDKHVLVELMNIFFVSN